MPSPRNERNHSGIAALKLRSPEADKVDLVNYSSSRPAFVQENCQAGCRRWTRSQPLDESLDLHVETSSRVEYFKLPAGHNDVAERTYIMSAFVSLAKT